MDIAYEVPFTVKKYALVGFPGFDKFTLTACSSNYVDANGKGFVPDGLGYVSGIVESDGKVIKRIPLQDVEFDKGEDLFEKSIVDHGNDGDEFSLWSHADTVGHASVRVSISQSFNGNRSLLHSMRSVVFGLFKGITDFIDKMHAYGNANQEQWSATSTNGMVLGEFGFSKFTDDASPVTSALCTDMTIVLSERYDAIRRVTSEITWY